MRKNLWLNEGNRRQVFLIAMSESESVHRPELKNYSFGGHTLPTIEDEALSFLSLYTSEPDLDSLRKRVTEVWQESKEKVCLDGPLWLSSTMCTAASRSCDSLNRVPQNFSTIQG